jgi:primosomal protein N' (replication factor Y) (superfamily II helicase)
VPRSVPEGGTGHHPRIARVAVEGAPLHLGDHLDYVVPDGIDVAVGHRVELSFAGRRTRGLVVAVDVSTELEPGRLRPFGRLLGDVPWLDASDVGLLQWAAARFGAPLGDVVRHALPNRVVDEERRARTAGLWPPDAVGDAPGLLTHVTDATATGPPVGWEAYGAQGHLLLAALTAGGGSFLWRPLPGEDVGARLVELTVRCVAAGRDVLLIVPDPSSGVADEVIGAMRSRMERPDVAVVDLRGGPTARMAFRGWLRARAGLARVVVGERGAAFMPLRRLGLAVVLDEASPVHKEQRSPRHNVREVLLERARRAGGVGLVTADVESAVCRSLVSAGRVLEIVAAEGMVARRRPRVHLETGALEARARISRAGLRVLRGAVEAGGYGVVLAARRGEGRALVCTRCRDLVRCTTCSAAIARSASGGAWCPACGAASARPPRCERCGPGELAPLAAGAERLGAELSRTLDVPVAVLEGHAPAVPHAPAVLVMTRGSVLDRPPDGGPVLGVVLPDIDGALRRPALDAAEDALRLAFRVSGWTVTRPDGPAEGAAVPVRPGSGHADPQVVVETRDPEHHALAALVAWDAAAFWRAEEDLRRPLRLPPHTPAIRLEVSDDLPDALTRVREHLADGDDVVGPLPLERGRRALLVRCRDRGATLEALRPLRHVLSRQGVEMRVDVDPVGLD